MDNSELDATDGKTEENAPQLDEPIDRPITPLQESDGDAAESAVPEDSTATASLPKERWVERARELLGPLRDPVWQAVGAIAGVAGVVVALVAIYAPPGAESAPLASRSDSPTASTRPSPSVPTSTPEGSIPPTPGDSPAPIRTYEQRADSRSGSDACAAWQPALYQPISYRACAHVNMTGWYGGIEVKNEDDSDRYVSIYTATYTSLPNGSNLRPEGHWNDSVLVPAGKSLYFTGRPHFPYTNRCVKIEARPQSAGKIEYWSASPVAAAINDRLVECKTP